MKRFVVILTVLAATLAWVLAGLAPVSASAQIPAAMATAGIPASHSLSASVTANTVVSGSFTPLPTARVFSGAASTTPGLVQVAGLGGVPVGATAVVVNTEVFAPTAAGYVRVTPAGLDPSVAVQEFAKGQTISNLVVVQLVGGKVQVKLSAGSAQIFMDVSGYYSAAAPVAPGPVTGVAGTPTGTSIALSWTNPASASLTGVMIRRATGGTAPVSATAGTLVTDAATPAATFTDTGLTPLTQYSYALFAHDSTPLYAIAATTSTTTAAGPGAVSGTVTDAGGTHHGLANVTVGVFSPSTSAFGSATTAADGSYTVTGLAAGTDYQVCFDSSLAAGGSSDATGYVAQCYNNQPTGTPTPVTVTADATMTGISAALADGGAISGTVTDAAGTHHGLANVTVDVSSASSGVYVGTVTAANGSYTITSLPAGTDYQVYFAAVGATGGSSDILGYLGQYYNDQPTSGTPTPVTVTAGANRTATNAALTAGGAISGTVTDAAGTHHGLANVQVNVASASTGASRSATTAANGSYTITSLPAGTDYQVCFTSAGATGGSSDARGYLDQCYNNQPLGFPTAVTVTAGATRAATNAALAAAGAVSGSVTDGAGTHHGLANVAVSVFSPSTMATGNATTAADGSYTVAGLLAGTDYQVCFDPRGATGGSSDASGYVAQCFNNQPQVTGTPTPVTVTPGATRTATSAALTAGGAVSGTVTDAAGAHHGLANVLVEADSSSIGLGYTVMTAVDGSYTITGLAAGADYQVCFTTAGATGGSSDGLGYLNQCYNNQPPSGTPDPVTVTAGATTTGINDALVADGAVSGMVTDAGGTHHGLANVQVSVGSQSTGVNVGTTTAADGTYTVEGLPAANDYTVYFGASGATGGSSDAFGYVDQFFNNQPTTGTPTPVTVTSGGTRTGANAALTLGGAVSGMVTDAGGAHHGLANVEVNVSSASTGRGASATTAADGSWTATGLAAGTDYQACFLAASATGGSSDALGYVDQCYNNQPTSGTPTPVTVTTGANRTGTNAALADNP